MPTPKNLFADLPTPLPDELCDTLLNVAGLRLERIVSHGHSCPEGFWYDQEESKWVLLIEGSARLQFEGEEPFQMTPGSFVNIPARKRHRVDWTLLS